MRGGAGTLPCAPTVDRHGRDRTRVPPPITAIRRTMDPSAYGCRRRRLATPMTRQRGSGPGCVEAALKTSISASSAASASSMNSRSESSSCHPPLVDRLMHDGRSAWPRRPQRSSSKAMSSSWGNCAAQDCPRCARAAFVQRSFRNVLRIFYDELGAQTSRGAPILPQELDSREDTSRNGDGARRAPSSVSRFLAPARLLVGIDAEAQFPHDLVGEGRASDVGSRPP